MLDIGFMELLVIGIVALIVVGPKDLPGMFKTLGRFTAKARGMAREFQRAMNDAADESGVKDVSKTLKAATSPKSMGLDTLNKAADSFEKWDPSKPASKTPQSAAEAAAKTRQDTVAAANKIQAEKAASFASKPSTPPPAPAPAAADAKSNVRSEGPRRPPRPVKKKSK
jgi:sec-independent protein translocase protein TatB